MSEAVQQQGQAAPEAQQGQQPGVSGAEGNQSQENQQPAEQHGSEAAQQQQEGQESEERKQSRAARRWNRMRDRAIAAETELRLLREERERASGVQHQGQEQRRGAPPADDAPKREQFDTYEDYIRADATYRAERAAEERTRKVLEESRKSETEQRQRAEHEKASQAWNAKVEAARDDFDDFDEVCAESEAVITQPMADAIRDSDKAGHLAYYLAKNPQEAERISKLSASKQVAAIVALEEKASKPAKAPSNAPAPINPGSGKSANAGGDAPSDKDDIDTWMRKEKARMVKAGVRL